VFFFTTLLSSHEQKNQETGRHGKDLQRAGQSSIFGEAKENSGDVLDVLRIEGRRLCSERIGRGGPGETANEEV